MREKRAKQEALNNSLMKRKRKNTWKADTSASESQDSTLDADDTDAEIRVNLGGSPTSYKLRNSRDAESSAEKRYAETFARNLVNTDGTPLTSIGASSSHKLQIRKSLEMEMDPEEDMFSSDDGEAISKVKRRNKNPILSSEESENEGIKTKKKSSSGSLLKKAIENSKTAALKDQTIDILETLNSPCRRNNLPSILSKEVDKNSFVLPHKAKTRKEIAAERRLSRSPYVLIENLKVKSLKPVTVEAETTDSDCIITDESSPIPKRVTRQSQRKNVEKNEPRKALVRTTRSRGRKQNSRKLPVISESQESDHGLVESSQDAPIEVTTVTANTQKKAQKRSVESDTAESEPVTKKRARGRTKVTRNKKNSTRNANPRKNEQEAEPTIADMLKEISKPGVANCKGNKSKHFEKGQDADHPNTYDSQSDEENNEPPWTDSEIRNLKRYFIAYYDSLNLTDKSVKYYIFLL